MIVVLLCSFISATVATIGSTDFLLINLLDNYDNRVIERENDQPLKVSVGFSLVQLHSLDEKKQILTTYGWFQVQWTDPRLKWNKTEYNIESTVIPTKNVWLPDIGFLNSASVYHNSMIKNEFRLVVGSDGSMLWVPGGTYRTSCELDISKFPFDKQACFLHISNWAYNGAEMDLVPASDVIEMTSYKPSAEWEITRTQTVRKTVVYKCCGDLTYPALFFHIWIKRKSLYYIVNIVTPCVILSLLATFSFQIPPGSGEKISLGITLLISVTVFQLIVADSVPRRSDSVPIISMYIAVLTGVVTLSIICSILTTQVHHRGETIIPHALRRFAFNFLAPLVCLCGLKHSYGTQSNRERDVELETSSFKLCQSSREFRHDSVYKLSVENGNNGFQTKTSPVVASIGRHMNMITDAVGAYERRKVSRAAAEYRAAEWKAVAKVFDRVFFIIFVIITLAITIVILIPF